MKNVLIVFGGRSAEHEISVRSARNIIDALDKKRFKPTLVAISRSGDWHLLKSDNISDNITAIKDDFCDGDICTMIRKQGKAYIITEAGATTPIDIAFPVLHGPMGEDGTIQGMFEMMMTPYVGPGVLSSAINMDKEMQKQRLENCGLPVVPRLCFNDKRDVPTFDEICAKLKCAKLFVKPAVMGSAVGVSKASNQAEFASAVKEAFEYGFKIMIEKAIVAREIECSVLGNDSPRASCVGEIKPNHEFYSYEAKYLDPNGADIIYPAENLSGTIVEKIRELAAKSFKACQCVGMARVDFFLDGDGEIYINELNTIPGFTSISMYPKLWEASGISYSELITKLLELADEEHEKKLGLKLYPAEL